MQLGGIDLRLDTRPRQRRRRFRVDPVLAIKIGKDLFRLSRAFRPLVLIVHAGLVLFLRLLRFVGIALLLYFGLGFIPAGGSAALTAPLATASGYRQTEESLKNLRAAWGFAHSGGYQALDSYH